MHTRPWHPIVVLPAVCMERYVSVAHDNLAQQINAVIKVLLLVCKGIGVVVIVGVIRFADFVYAVK